MKARVSEKGQVTIPKSIRDRLGLRPGQDLEFTEDGAEIRIRKAVREDALDSLFGLLKKENVTTDQVMSELRGD